MERASWHRPSSAVSPIKLDNGFADAIDVRLAQTMIDRQAHDPFRLLLCLRKVAAAVTKVLCGFHQMQRSGIVHLRTDPTAIEVLAKRVAPLGLHHERVVYRIFVFP